MVQHQEPTLTATVHGDGLVISGDTNKITQLQNRIITLLSTHKLARVESQSDSRHYSFFSANQQGAANQIEVTPINNQSFKLTGSWEKLRSMLIINGVDFVTTLETENHKSADVHKTRPS
jgi:hypothetical protein